MLKEHFKDLMTKNDHKCDAAEVYWSIENRTRSKEKEIWLTRPGKMMTKYNGIHGGKTSHLKVSRKSNKEIHPQIESYCKGQKEIEGIHINPMYLRE